MAARIVRTAAPAPGRSAPSPLPWDWALDLGRQQMAVATESACTVLRGFEALRRIQEQSAREATEQRAKFAQKLGKPATPAEMMALQAELLRHDWEAATRYWQQVSGAALETATELCACTVHLVDSEDMFAATAPRFLHS